MLAPDQLAAIAAAFLVVTVTPGRANAAVFAAPAMAAFRSAGRWINGAVAGLFSTGGLGLIRSAFAR